MRRSCAASPASATRNSPTTAHSFWRRSPPTRRANSRRMPTFLAADGADLAYTDDGPRGGIPLLFLHGWNGAATLWTPVIERLAPRHRALAVDFRGFGASSGAPGPYRV